MDNPASISGAMGVIATATLVIVVFSGVAMRLLDHSDYPTIWLGMWWAIQTVTTVGYGDVTPKHEAGRIVASFVMLEGIAFLAIITAGITSTFINRTGVADQHAAAERQRLLEARFDELDQRLAAIHTLLADQTSGP